MATSIVNANVNYVIYFTSSVAYNAALDLIEDRITTNPNQAFLSPGDAASIFNFVDGVNYNIPGNLLNSTAGMYGTAPYFLGLPSPGNEIDDPDPSGVFMDGNVKSVSLPFPFIFHHDGRLTLTWCATFVLIAQFSLQCPIPLRRWAVGFEYPGAEGGSPSGVQYSRDASRTMDGIGWALRGSINVNFLQPLPTPANHSWERIYMRVRSFGAAKIDFWNSQGFPSVSVGIRLYLNPNGSVNVYSVNSSGTEVLLGTTAVIFVLNEFIRLDLVIEYSGPGSFTILIDGVIINSFTVAVIGGGNSHTATLLGTQQVVSATGWEIDFDDWHDADVPSIFICSTTVEAVETPTFFFCAASGTLYTIYPSVDYLNGTHVRAQKINSGTIGAFTGNIQSANQGIAPQFVDAGATLTSTTASDSITGTMDTNDTTDDPFSTILCACAATVAAYYNVAAGTPSNSVFGYSLNGTTATKNVADGTSLAWRTFFWPGFSGNNKNPPIIPMQISLTKAANTSKITINAFIATVQYIGVWGVEDDSNTQLPRTYLTHNAQWPTIADAFIGPSAGPVFAAAVGGTYVGNGTEQSITVPFPIHFLWIRPVGNTNPGVKWFAASLSAHRGNGSGAMRPDLMVRVDYNTPFNPTDTFTFTVLGTALEVNQNGVTYQYVAFCDPSFQFNLCGAWSHISSAATKVNNLLDPTFTPVAAFYSFDRSDNDSNIRLIYKGAGHSGTTASLIDGTALSNAGLLGVGAITSGTDNQNALGNQVNYSAFNATNGCSQTMVQVLSYVGNGASSRVISLTPATTRFPLLVYVQPHNTNGFVCDPSDIAPSSRNITSGGATATAITAVGADSITVGTTLNSNGIIYEVFVICGDTAGFNNGEFIAVPCTPTSLVPTPGTIVPGAIVIIPVGGIEFDGAISPSLLKDVSGIYQLVKGQTHDILLDRQPVQKVLDIAIPDIKWKTGYIGG